METDHEKDVMKETEEKPSVNEEMGDVPSDTDSSVEESSADCVEETLIDGQGDTISNGETSDEMDIVAALNEENKILTEKNAELEDRLLRLTAEMENQRRRMMRENENRVNYAIESFARDLLSIGDNFARALSVVGDKERNGVLSSFIEGVEMTEREFFRILSTHKISHFESLGKEFNPKYHQAMIEVFSDEYRAGMVMEVAQEGYMLGDRVLRPSMVCVSKGGEKTMQQEEEKQEEEGMKADISSPGDVQ